MLLQVLPKTGTSKSTVSASGIDWTLMKASHSADSALPAALTHAHLIAYTATSLYRQDSGLPARALHSCR